MVFLSSIILDYRCHLSTYLLYIIGFNGVTTSLSVLNMRMSNYVTDNGPSILQPSMFVYTNSDFAVMHI